MPWGSRGCHTSLWRAPNDFVYAILRQEVWLQVCLKSLDLESLRRRAAWADGIRWRRGWLGSRHCCGTAARFVRVLCFQSCNRWSFGVDPVVSWSAAEGHPLGDSVRMFSTLWATMRHFPCAGLKQEPVLLKMSARVPNTQLCSLTHVRIRHVLGFAHLLGWSPRDLTSM